MCRRRLVVVVVGAAFGLYLVVCVLCLSVVGLVVVCRGDGSRESCWLFESAPYTVAFRRVPCRAILCRRVFREIAVVSVGSG